MSSVLGALGVPLPRGARPDLAYYDTVKTGGVFVATQQVVTAPGETLLVPLSCELVLTTSAAVGSREALYVVLDNNGAEVKRAPVTTTQGPNVGNAYVWSVDVGAAYGSGANNFAAPLPRTIALPGWKIGVQVNGLQAGDVGSVTLEVVRIPTGPERAEAEPALTPVLL